MSLESVRTDGPAATSSAPATRRSRRAALLESQPAQQSPALEMVVDDVDGTLIPQSPVVGNPVVPTPSLAPSLAEPVVDAQRQRQPQETRAGRRERAVREAGLVARADRPTVARQETSPYRSTRPIGAPANVPQAAAPAPVTNASAEPTPVRVPQIVPVSVRATPVAATPVAATPVAATPVAATPVAVAPVAVPPVAVAVEIAAAAVVDEPATEIAATPESAPTAAAVAPKQRTSRAPGRRASTATRSSRHAWLPRTAVIAVLAVTTIALPTTGALTAIKGTPVKKLVSPDQGQTLAGLAATALAAAEGPSTLDVLRGDAAQQRTPKILAQRLSESERTMAAASRTQIRSALPTCDAGVATGGNGRLSLSALCELPQGGYYLQPEAAIAFAELSQAFETAFGRPLIVSSAYRSYGQQASLRSVKPGLAASAGTSNHGWGYAIDLSSATYKSASAWNWIVENAPKFGWQNPQWAKTSKYEPWHWEYVSGVASVGGFF